MGSDQGKWIWTIKNIKSVGGHGSEEIRFMKQVDPGVRLQE